MNNIELTSLIKCEECNQIYEDPVILPCHMTICSKHQTKTKTYQCKNCNQDHIRPENGYPSDKKALKLIEMRTFINKEQINFGPEHQYARDVLKTLENLILETDLLTRESVVLHRRIF